jgi:hypothetical protein
MTAKSLRSDLGWKWKAYAGRSLLVTDGGGEQVILSAKHHSSLTTRDLESGMLRASPRRITVTVHRNPQTPSAGIRELSS